MTPGGCQPIMPQIQVGRQELLGPVTQLGKPRHRGVAHGRVWVVQVGARSLGRRKARVWDFLVG